MGKKFFNVFFFTKILVTILNASTESTHIESTYTSEPEIVCVGNIILDNSYTTDKKFLKDNNLDIGQMQLVTGTNLHNNAENNCKKIQSSPGGAGCNTIVGLKNLGLNVGVIGTIANDNVGHLYIKSLVDKSIQYRATITNMNELGSGVSSIFITGKNTRTIKRTMATNPGVSSYIDLSESTEWATAAPFLLIEGYLFGIESVYNSICEVAKKSVENHNKVVLTLSADHYVRKYYDRMWQFISITTIVIGNDSEAKILTKTDSAIDAAKALQNKGKVGAVTCGPDGAYVFDKTGVYFIASLKVAKVIDITGAGDQFAAGFLYEILKEGNIIGAGQLGSFCAGEAIQHFGSHPNVSLTSEESRELAYNIPCSKIP